MEPLDPGVFKTVAIKFDYIGEKISVGSKLRLAIAGNYFPTFIPNPEPVNFQIEVNKLQLEMPTLVSSEPLTDVIPAITKCKPMEYVTRTDRSYAKMQVLTRLVATSSILNHTREKRNFCLTVSSHRDNRTRENEYETRRP